MSRVGVVVVAVGILSYVQFFCSSTRIGKGQSSERSIPQLILVHIKRRTDFRHALVLSHRSVTFIRHYVCIIVASTTIVYEQQSLSSLKSYHQFQQHQHFCMRQSPMVSMTYNGHSPSPPLVVYFHQQMGALLAVCWLNIIYFESNVRQGQDLLYLPFS